MSESKPRSVDSRVVNNRALDTLAVHAGETPRIAGAVVTPVFQSSTFELGDGHLEPGSDAAYASVGYMRLSNSANHEVLHRKLASLESAEAAVVTGSGMAAIATTLLALLHSGDHVIALDCLYGGTHAFVTDDLPKHGVEHTLVAGDDPAAWQAALRPTTRVFYVETVTNPLVRVFDLERIAAFARDNGLIAIIDNTFASPVNCRPAERGFGIVIESATKYLNGHSDLVAGVVAGRADLVGRVRALLDHTGAVLDTHACFLLQRGLKTLGLRVRQQNSTAHRLAERLAEHPEIRALYYPGLPTDAVHQLAARQLDGFGGMLAFELARPGTDAVRAFVHRLQLVVHATSLGGVESLVSIPAGTSHAPLSSAERQRAGISDQLIRLSIGIEDADDLIADVVQALG